MLFVNDIRSRRSFKKSDESDSYFEKTLLYFHSFALKKLAIRMKNNPGNKWKKQH